MASNNAVAGRQAGRPDTQINGHTDSGQTGKWADRVGRNREMGKQIQAQMVESSRHTFAWASP